MRKISGAFLRQRSRWEAQVDVLRQQEALLRGELVRIIQRVNLFEKIMIPQAKDAIRMIRIKLGDEMTAAVGRAKIAKEQLARTLTAPGDAATVGKDEPDEGNEPEEQDGPPEGDTP